jgi:hypothetical protein
MALEAASALEDQKQSDNDIQTTMSMISMTVDEIYLQMSSKVVIRVGQACRDGHHSGDCAQMNSHRALGQWLHLPSNVNGHGPRDNDSRF